MQVDERSGGVTTPSEDPAQARRPFWLIALALAGLIVAILGGAFVLNARLRPQVGIESGQPTFGIAATTSPSLADSQTPAAQPTIITPASMPTPSVDTLPGIRVAESPLEREIEAAYLRYWEVRSQAYFDLDPSRLSEVMDGAELSRETAQIGQLKAQGKAAKLDIQHRAALAQVSPDAAVVYDEYMNRSVFVDPVTKRELPTSSPPEMEKVSYQMKKLGGTWKVVDGSQHE